MYSDTKRLTFLLAINMVIACVFKWQDWNKALVISNSIFLLVCIVYEIRKRKK